MRRAAVAVADAVLGAACTGDRPAPEPDGIEGEARPVCEQVPGRGVEGFLLTRTREIRYPDRVALRKEYRDRSGRLLVYLLGVSGEVGEGAGPGTDVTLTSGAPARLRGRGANWTLTWAERFPCTQMSVVGNGFEREEFVALLEEADLLSADEPIPTSPREWVAVFDAARRIEALDPSQDELLDTAGRNIAVGQVECWTGLASEVGAGAGWYVAAVVAPTEEELDAAVARVGRELMFRGELEAHCVD